MRILCTADLHIGRTSSRLPREADASRFTARAAWARVVDLALAQKADVLAVAGDVIDASANYFEAFGPLEAGLRRLSAAGIETFFVAGNHDFDSLPRFCDQFSDPRAHLLGRGGAWERRTIERGGVRLNVDGWSFRAAAHETNPLLGYSLARDGVPTLGLLHADVEQAGSPYAPCSVAELLAKGPALWLLGHVHRTNRWPDGAALAFYPGSPQALDPGERGAHGAWLVDWTTSSAASPQLCALSTIRYEQCDVSVEGCADLAAVEAALHAALAEKLRECATDAAHLAWLSCRFILRGRTQAHERLVRGVENIEQIRREAHGVTAFVERVDVDTRPTLDIVELAKGTSPPGLLARLLLALENGESHPLVADAHRRIESAFRSMPVDGDGEPAREGAPAQLPPGSDAVRAVLLAQGHRLLTQLTAPAA